MSFGLLVVVIMIMCRWRRLLIELFDEHRDSVVLGDYCMQQLSQKGHNTGTEDGRKIRDIYIITP